MYFNSFRQNLKYRKNRLNIFVDAHENNEKIGILFRFCTKNSYFFIILIQFESTLNWLSITDKIYDRRLINCGASTIYKKKISFKIPENSPS